MEFHFNKERIMLNQKKTEEIMQIFKTYDYSIFKKLDGNREIDIKHLNNLKKSIDKTHLPIPIVINEKYEIIDGQHRLEISGKLKLPVYYIIINGATLDDVKLLNTNSKAWNLKDYLHSYCKSGNKTYLAVRKFINEHGFGMVDSLTMLSCTKTNRGIDQRKFKTGIYEIKDINKANETALKIEEVKTYFSKYQSRSFVLSMILLFHNKDYNHKKFIRNLSLFPTKLKSCSNKYDYLKNIEEIYNYNQKKKIRLF
tara:strand:+ start:241 stop:1005 length:765 start_codon:yes stop_codon:yes gene_type:complete